MKETKEKKEGYQHEKEKRENMKRRKLYEKDGKKMIKGKKGSKTGGK